jgi:23S rRNA G2069 N7-methylase RlmK/C1962 C5-methylase RlmI
MTCSCSSAMTQKNGGQFFLETVKGAALSAGRQITLLRTSGAAPCHTQCPASFPAGAYLTAATFYVSPKAS